MVPYNNLALCFNHMYIKWSRNGAEKVKKKYKTEKLQKKIVSSLITASLSSSYNLELTRPVFGFVVEVIVNVL